MLNSLVINHTWSTPAELFRNIIGFTNKYFFTLKVVTSLDYTKGIL